MTSILTYQTKRSIETNEFFFIFSINPTSRGESHVSHQKDLIPD